MCVLGPGNVCMYFFFIIYIMRTAKCFFLLFTLLKSPVQEGKKHYIFHSAFTRRQLKHNIFISLFTRKTKKKKSRFFSSSRKYQDVCPCLHDSYMFQRATNTSTLRNQDPILSTRQPKQRSALLKKKKNQGTFPFTRSFNLPGTVPYIRGHAASLESSSASLYPLRRSPFSCSWIL